MISEYRAEHDWQSDSDRDATEMMFSFVCDLYDGLRRQFPICARCEGDWATNDVLCDERRAVRILPES